MPRTRLKMRFLVCLLISLFVVNVYSSNYFFGKKPDKAKPVRRERIYESPFPWSKQGLYFYYNNTATPPIKAIYCYDYQNTAATINITDGGIGYNHVAMRLRSERSYGLDYAIEIYV